MSYDRFIEVHKLTAEFEGGWSNHPSDPGGKTMYGITEKVYNQWRDSKNRPRKPVRNISKDEALEIYYEEYWLRARCDKLNLGVDRMVYDAAVNSGVSRSRSWLMKSIGGPDRQTVINLYNIRLSFLKRLSTWNTFGRGWKRRLDAMKEAALKEVGNEKQVVVKPKPVEQVVKPSKPTLWEGILEIIRNIFGVFR